MNRKTPRVETPEGGGTNLLGLLLANLLTRNLSRPEVARKLASLTGTLRVEAGRMAVDIQFQDGTVTVRSPGETRPTAKVSGSLPALADLSLGGGVLSSYLKGRIRAAGRLFFLLKILPLIRVSDVQSEGLSKEGPPGQELGG